MLKKLSNNNLFGFIIVLLLCLGATWSLLRPGYFSMHDNIQIMRFFEMEKCFRDGQLPCRWVPDMGAGFGYPLFNFYSPFVYYLGMVFRLFNFSFISITKIIFGLSFVVSGLFIYLLVKEFFGKVSGIVTATLYLYAPYHSVDVYVRGALAESWAIALFPVIFWVIFKYLNARNSKWFLLSVLSLTVLFLSHNIMLILFLPLVVVWMVFLTLSYKKTFILKDYFFMLLLSFGIGAFFTIPSFFEKALVNISWLTTDYFDFRNHFVSVGQLFIKRFWGYGPSVLGNDDRLSLQLGWTHWFFAVVCGLLSILYWFKKKDLKLGVLILFFLFWAFSIFMTHAKSVFIWNTLPLLSYVQFPWRFLGISMFAAAFLGGGLVYLIQKYKNFAAGTIIFLTVVLNIAYFRPQYFYPKATDQVILSGESWKEQSMGALLDYLPNSVKIIPQQLAPTSPWIVEGAANITEFSKRSDFWRFSFESITNVPSVVRLPVFDFASWTVLIDQQKVEHKSDNQEGVIELNIPPGKHTIVGFFEDTMLRSIANMVSLISFSILILTLVIKAKNEKVA